MRCEPIPGHPNYVAYENGAIYSLPRKDRLGRQVGGKLLKQFVNPRGYCYVRMDNVRRPVHHIVLEAFGFPRPDGYMARHINDIQTDNRIENLAWGTAKDNANDRQRNNGYGKKSHCINGHAYTPENTWLTSQGWQQCRACHRVRERERKAL